MPPERDFIHRFKKYPEHPIEAKCRYRVWRPDPGTVVIVATELPDNPGVSITNWAEYLATEFRWLHMNQGEALIWIEHHPGRPSRYDPKVTVKEEFDRVLMRWNGTSYEEPDWKPFDREGVERLIREPLGE